MRLARGRWGAVLDGQSCGRHASLGLGEVPGSTRRFNLALWMLGLIASSRSVFQPEAPRVWQYNELAVTTEDRGWLPVKVP